MIIALYALGIFYALLIIWGWLMARPPKVLHGSREQFLADLAQQRIVSRKRAA